MPKSSIRSGDWRCICDYSGRKVWASQCRMTWDGYFVRKDLWEPRQPQDFVRGIKDQQTVPVSRPEQTDTFVSTPVSRDDL